MRCHLRRFAEPPDSALDDIDLVAFGDLDLEADLDLAAGEAEPHDDPLLLGAGGDPWLARDPDLEREFLSDPFDLDLDIDLDLDLDIDLDLDLEKDRDADLNCDLDLDLDKARSAELALLELLDLILLDPKFSSSSDEDSICISLQGSNTQQSKEVASMFAPQTSSLSGISSSSKAADLGCFCCFPPCHCPQQQPPPPRISSCLKLGNEIFTYEWNRQNQRSIFDICYVRHFLIAGNP